MNDPILLYLDTSTQVCSVALSRGEVALGKIERPEPNAHATELTLMIDQLLVEQGLSLADVSALVVAKGPGSYTGLRIGMSVAKGICFALGIPLIAIDSLESLAWGFSQHFPDGLPQSALLCPMIDARRMEVYRAVFSPGMELLRDTEAVVIEEGVFDFMDPSGSIVLFGSGADKLSSFYEGVGQIHVVEGFDASASAMIPLGLSAYRKREFVDLAYFEPLYLKPFVPSSARRRTPDGA